MFLVGFLPMWAWVTGHMTTEHSLVMSSVEDGWIPFTGASAGFRKLTYLIVSENPAQTRVLIDGSYGQFIIPHSGLRAQINLHVRRHTNKWKKNVRHAYWPASCRVSKGVIDMQFTFQMFEAPRLKPLLPTFKWILVVRSAWEVWEIKLEQQ